MQLRRFLLGLRVVADGGPSAGTASAELCCCAGASVSACCCCCCDGVLLVLVALRAFLLVVG